MLRRQGDASSSWSWECHRLGNEAPEIPSDEPKAAVKRQASIQLSGKDFPSRKVRKIIPTKIGEVRGKIISFRSSSEHEIVSQDEKTETKIDDETMPATSKNAHDAEPKKQSDEPGSSNSKEIKPVLRKKPTEEMIMLIRACCAAEPSPEMKIIIKAKVLKYYRKVHPEFVTSKIFLQSLKSTTKEIVKEPHLVYSKLKVIIEELDARRLGNDFDTVNGIGEELQELQLRKLNMGLAKLKCRIQALEVEEVDWDDDDNSAYLKKARYEKRACDIYEKICEITGESKHAHRIVKKPIVLKSDKFPEFYKKLQMTVNAKNSFPNFLDVLKCLDFCNKRYDLHLSRDQMKPIAQNAFEDLGKKLQARRRNDLYETTTHYVGKEQDPAKTDVELRSSLGRNKIYFRRCDDVINDYAEMEKKVASEDEVKSDLITSTPKMEGHATILNSSNEFTPDEESHADNKELVVKRQTRKKYIKECRECKEFYNSYEELNGPSQANLQDRDCKCRGGRVRTHFLAFVEHRRNPPPLPPVIVRDKDNQTPEGFWDMPSQLD